MADEPIDISTTTTGVQAGHSVTHNGTEYDAVKEGLAYILRPKAAPPAADAKEGSKVDSESQTVFYNPIQQFNRDLSVLAIRAYGEALIAEKVQRREKKARDTAGGGERGKKRKREDGDDRADKGSEQKSARPGGPAEVGASGEASAAFEPGIVQDSRSTETDVQNAETTVSLTKDDPTPQPSHKPEYSTATISDIRNAIQDAVPSILKDTSSGGGKTSTAQSNGTTNATPLPKPWKPTFTILDALSASGLRALRYAKEIPFLTSVTANDLSKEATTSIKVNIQHNKLEDHIFAITSDARVHMYSMASQQSPKQPSGHYGKYDVIDLDPYGTAAPFFDAAVQAVNDGGLLCVTCTDSGVFASVGHLEKTYALYGGLPWKGPQSHEAGLRLIIHAIATSAARYGLAIEPLLSLSIDFYVRIFLRVRRSPAEVKLLAGKTMIVFNCDSGCGAWSTQLLARNREMKDKKGSPYYKHSLAQGPSSSEHCEHCGLKTHVAGPMWAGPLHNNSFIQRILDLLPGLDGETYPTIPRIDGMLSTALAETIPVTDPSKSVPRSSSQEPPSSFARNEPFEIDHAPFFFIPSTVSKVLHCQTPSEDQWRGAIRSLGYHVTRSHAKPGSLRTDAPWSVLWEIMREWVRQRSPVKESVMKEGTAGWGIMQKSRAHSYARRLKDEIKAALEKGGDVDELRTGVEAALYRAGQERSTKQEEPKTDVGVDDPQPTTLDVLNSTSVITGQSTDPSRLRIVFDETLGREPERKKLVRYQVNPRPNWGPMNRAKGP
ncbi:RNA methyltransferase tRNA(m5U54)methyltransferase [Acarospora aff. strigata]|nr:RNA methyltransferase tRNA(m5U54)methyltransferase [Acarospora aff. strigata]